LAERVLGKDEVTGSIPVIGSRFENADNEANGAWRRKSSTARNHT
jgi:hypothetical protein